MGIIFHQDVMSWNNFQKKFLLDTKEKNISVLELVSNVALGWVALGV